MIETRQPRIETALGIVDEESDVLSAEKRAFEDFLARLVEGDGTSLRATGTVHAMGGSGAATGGWSASTGGGTAGTAALAVADAPPSKVLERIRTAYRETVMSVPHYETDYGDSLFENLAAEFGRDLARQVTRGPSVTPVLYEALVDGTKRARAERTRFLAALRRERESLERTRDELNDCETEAIRLGDRIAGSGWSDELGAIDRELEALERRCESISRRRQQLLHSRPITNLAGVGTGGLSQYLYGECETTCPALADVSDCVETIRLLRRRCLR
ncbi:MAG: hypothetical protein ABEJ28_10680 [Salinigranum sp.]